MFSNPFPNTFGLDITDLSIKAVQLRNTSLFHKHPTYELVSARSIEIPPGLIVNGDIQEPESIRKYIKHLLQGKGRESHPIVGPWVVASLPEVKNYLARIYISKSPLEIIPEDITIAAKQHIPLEEQDYFLDWEIIPETMPDDSKKKYKDRTAVLIAATNKTTANMYTYLIESLGLGVLALETESLATARSMVTADKLYDGEARAILHIGASKTTISIYDNNSIQFSRVLPYSGEIVTTALMQKLHISHEEAEQLKCSVGVTYAKKTKQGKAWQIIMNTTTALIDDIQDTIQFYYSHFPTSNTITHITMCGGGSMLPGLGKVIAKKLDIQAAPGNPWKNLSSSLDIEIPQTETLRYACAIGLALRAADNPFFEKDTI